MYVCFLLSDICCLLKNDDNDVPISFSPGGTWELCEVFLSWGGGGDPREEGVFRRVGEGRRAEAGVRQGSYAETSPWRPGSPSERPMIGSVQTPRL